MKINSTVALALFLIASSAQAARDEVLIKQTRKNQLAHDATQRADKAAHDAAAAAASTSASAPASVPASAAPSEAGRH